MSEPAIRQISPDEDRIVRMRRRYQTGPAYISVERARYYTESWQESEGQPAAIRVALAMKHVFENMTYYLDPDERIAGTWCEYFLGIPVPIERGEYNTVLAAELTKGAMLRFRAGALARGLSYMARKGVLREFIKNQKISKRAGAQPLNMSLSTMGERKINPFQIKDRDRRELTSELLPYWKGRCLCDKLEKELLATNLYSLDMHDFVTALPGNTSRQVMMLSTCATIATIQGHVILDYDKVLKMGLVGMAAEVDALLADKKTLDSERDFLKSIRLSIEGVMTFARGVAVRVARERDRESDPVRKQELAGMAARCERVPLDPPSDFREAVQAMWTVKTAIELALPVNLQCFGRLDQILEPYYRADLESGRLTRADAEELVCELLLKIMSQNIRPESNILANFYHRFLGSSPVTLGGMTPDGQDATNDLTYLFVDAAHRSKAITNLSVRVHPGTPSELLERIAGHLADGTSSYSLFNDEVSVPAMLNKGFDLKDARDHAVMGCVELTCPGRTGAMSASALLLARLLDITLRRGDSATLAGTMKREGLDTGDPDSFIEFEEFLEALYKQGRHFIDKIVKGSNLKDALYERELPSPYISTFMKGCLESCRDVTAGGAKYDLTGISMINSIANLADSLLVIKKLVYEGRRYTFSDLLSALDSNFEGHQELLDEIRAIEGKWGNGSEESDRLAGEVTEKLFRMTYDYRNHRGGPFVVYVISMITHTVDGRLSIAGPDGRRAATPYAASCNPYNVEKSGVTAALRSVAALPFPHCMGSAVNMKFHPTAVGKSPETRKKWAALIRAYFGMGGAQLQPTVASAEMLKQAKDNPDAYRDLIVKVGGYSTYFVDLGREIQDEVIARTLHGEN